MILLAPLIALFAPATEALVIPADPKDPNAWSYRNLLADYMQVTEASAEPKGGVSGIPGITGGGNRQSEV